VTDLDARTTAGRARRIPLAALIGALFAVPACVQAQQAGTELAPVVITGSRLPGTPSGLAQNVTVIDRQQIQESNPGRLEDVLGRITGVYVDQAGQAGGFSSLYMRGAEQSQLLIMVDGVKVNDPTTTRGSAYDLSSIDVNQIERIEVLRGPASAIHGGEALAGVLNIVTRRSTLAGVSGSGYVAAGRGRFGKIGGSVAAGNETLRAQLGVGSSREGSDSGDGKLEQNKVSGSLRFVPGGTVGGELYFHRSGRQSSAFPDDSGGPRLAVNREKTTRDATDTIYGASLGGGDAATLRVQAGVSVYERDEQANNAFIDGGVRFPVPAFTSDTRFKRTTATITATHEYNDRASVVAGLERQTEDGDLASVGDFDFDGLHDTLQFGLKRSTGSVFVEGRIRVADPLSLQIGVRRDKVEGLDAETTPHLGAVWELPGGATTLKASYSKGFKPPSFFALGFPIGGNPALRPERSRNAELTVAHRFDGEANSLHVSVFRIDYKDLVDFDGNTFQNVNRGAIVVKGIEPTLKLQWGRQWRTQIGLTLLDIDAEDGLATLRNRPEKRAAASLVYDIDDRASLFAGLSSTGRYLDRSNPTGDITMPGYSTVDLAYSRRFGPLQAKFALDNLFDKHHEQFVGFPARERRLRVELRAEF
jgi:iron complex outermembrane receptor protein/vitamin B12 transporter